MDAAGRARRAGHAGGARPASGSSLPKVRKSPAALPGAAGGGAGEMLVDATRATSTPTRIAIRSFRAPARRAWCTWCSSAVARGVGWRGRARRRRWRRRIVHSSRRPAGVHPHDAAARQARRTSESCGESCPGPGRGPRSVRGGARLSTTTIRPATRRGRPSSARSSGKGSWASRWWCTRARRIRRPRRFLGREAGPGRRIIHCFNQRLDRLRSGYLALGMYLSLLGRRHLQECGSPCVTRRPGALEAHLVETDSPFLAPVPTGGSATSRHTLP